MNVRYIPGLLCLLLAGCGYHFAGEQVSLPEDVHSVSVGHIENRSREQGLEKTLAFALEREVFIRRHLSRGFQGESSLARSSGHTRGRLGWIPSARSASSWHGFPTSR